MNRLHSLARIFVCLLAFLPACSPVGRLEEARREVRKYYRSVPSYECMEERKISWATAMMKLKRDNLDLAQALNEWAEARNREKKIYRDLISLVNLGYYYNVALFGGKNTYGKGGTYNINIIFDLPSLTRIPLEHYTSSLVAFKAKKNCELKERELTARMYQLFREYDWLKQNEAISGSMSRKSRDDYQACQLQVREKWKEFCLLINDFSCRWIPDCSTLPNLRWEDYRAKSELPAELTQTMMALELEASRLKSLGILLNYWPTIRTDFYSPTLFNITGGHDSGFMTAEKDVRVNMNFYLQVDTRLEVWFAAREARAAHELLVRRLRQGLFGHKEQIGLILQSWEMYMEWKKAMIAYCDFKRRQGAVDPDGLQALNKESADFRREILERARENLERECALIQEYGIL